MEIRLLTAADVDAYWRVRLEALETEPEAFSSSPEEHRALTLADLETRLAAPDSFVVGAFEDGRLVGTAAFFRERGPKLRHKGNVAGVYVTPALRGRGLARGMLQELLERAAALDGLEQIALTVTPTQAAAVALYRALGFVSFGREPRALKLGDRYVDKDYMVRLVARSS